MLTIVLTRHGHTDRSEPDQYLGQTIDLPLSDQGRAEAGRLRARLEGVAFDRVISSPLLRAKETAHIVRPADAIELDARLAEADYGEWEGRLVADIAAHDATRRAAWEDDPADVGPPGGERGLDVAARVRSLLDELIASAGSQPLVDRRYLLVGHSTLGRILLAVALGVPVRDYRRRFRVDWLSLSVLRFTPGEGAMLLLCNDVSHVRGMHAPLDEA